MSTLRAFPDPTILLHPNIPKPLHTLNPRTLLGQNWWDDKRWDAYDLHDDCCHACGIHKSNAKYHKWLEGHEMYDINYDTGAVVFTEVVALCHSCHNYIHSGRMSVLRGTEEMPEEKYLDIRNHGDSILRKHNLKFVSPNVACSWSDYHLVIEGVNYGRRFESYEAWESYWEKG